MVNARALLIMYMAASSALAQSNPEKDESIKASWLDTMHRNIAESMNESARWVDSFFYDPKLSTQERPEGEARIRLGWEPRTRDITEFEAKIRVRYKLPKMKNRVDLILSDYEDDRPEEKIRAGRVGDVSREDRFNLALRFRKSPDAGLSHRIGIGRRAQIFAKSRYRQHHNFDALDIYWQSSVAYYNRDKWGADTEITFDYKLSDSTMFRFDNQFYFRDTDDNWLWQHSWQHFNHLQDDAALVLGLYIEGNSRPLYQLDEYLTSARWRKNALREWLFFEVEPFILWRRDENFSASYGVALRVEGYFNTD